jgi:hypothetical protein
MPRKENDKKDLFYLRENENLKKQLEIDALTWKAVCSLSMLAPVLKLQAIDGAHQSPIVMLPKDGAGTVDHEGWIYKVYPFNVFRRNEDKIQQYTNETAIMALAYMKELDHIVRMEQIYLGPDHAAVKMARYQMDYRVYLQKHRNPRELRLILR